MRRSNNLENKTVSDINWRDRLVYMKVPAHSSLEPPLEYNQDQTSWRCWWIKVCCDVFNHLGSYGNSMQFQISSRRETGKEKPELPRLEFLETFSANNFALSNAENNSSRPTIADWPLLRTLLAIPQKSWDPSFWEVIDFCFSSMCKFGSFKILLATITSLYELYFRFRRIILLVQMKKVISMAMAAAAQAAENHGDQ